MELHDTAKTDWDLSRVRIPYNRVLIKLDPDHQTYHSRETGSDTGIYVAPFGANQAHHVSLTGTIVAVPDAMIYNGNITASMKQQGDRSQEVQKEVARLRAESMAYDVPMEVRPGMRVYFEYTTRLNAFKEGRALHNDEGKFIFVPYDLLIMAFKPTTDLTNIQVGDVYMLNGMVLIKPLEYATERTATGVVGVKTEADLFMPTPDDAKYVKAGKVWYGTVLATGCCVKGYADFPGKGDERNLKSDPSNTPGMKICYNGQQQKRLENPDHRIIFPKYELYRIHRKDIFGCFPNGKIS